MQTEGFLRRLELAFEHRKKINPNFSLRAYARLLKLSPAQLSRLRNGRRKLTRGLAHHILEESSLSFAEREGLFSEISSKKFLKPAWPDFTELPADKFHEISRWYHYATLNLCYTLKGSLSADSISRELEVAKKEAAQILRCLERLKLIARVGHKFRRTSGQLRSTDGVPDAVIRDSHREILHRAALSLDRDPVTRNDFTNMTMAIDPARLPSAKELIREFQNKLCKFLEEGDKKVVYTLSVQLFPVSKYQGEKT
jgi:uncharacterized protein (TIGR02147 family)